MKGYIYIRFHESYEKYNACKMGKTDNIPDRNSQYLTYEIQSGNFKVVFEIPNEKMSHIERMLQTEFHEFNIKYDAGTEYFHQQIVSLIEPYFIEIGLEYRKLTQEEINDFTRRNRDISLTSSPSSLTLLLSPRNDQTPIIEKSVAHFQHNDKGTLVLICGVGKTLISLWTAQRLNIKTLLIGVPNTLLLGQWKKYIHGDKNTVGLFPNIPLLIVSQGASIKNIEKFLKKNTEECVVITTYSSSHKVSSVVNKFPSFVFQMKINDECHHLTSSNMRLEPETTTYIHMLNIPSVKQLSLTATLKLLENTDYGDGNGDGDDPSTSFSPSPIVVSNNNIEYFGEIIERKNLLWGIQHGIVCDYDVQTIITDEERFEQHLAIFRVTEENDKRLWLSAYSALKSIQDGHSHHLLIYSNKTINSNKIFHYLKELLKHQYFDIPELYCSTYYGDMKTSTKKEILTNFETAPFGIITCVYCLGEGWDFPILDAVVFAENMSSNIRIVQSALRASRKNPYQPGKITKIILPILNRIQWLENTENSDLKKVREVIYQMGLEDETITQKIRVCRIDIEKHPRKEREKKEDNHQTVELGEYDDELTQKLKLKTVKRMALNITFEKARRILAHKKLKSKNEYYALCEKDGRLSADPEIVFKGQFTNWIEYLSLERIYYELEICKIKVGEYLDLYPPLKKHRLDLSYIIVELCKLDPLFPPNEFWAEYYYTNDLRTVIDIVVIVNKKKKMGVSI
jgi:superfamily II DNA or RNA helicase